MELTQGRSEGRKHEAGADALLVKPRSIFLRTVVAIWSYCPLVFPLENHSQPLLRVTCIFSGFLPMPRLNNPHAVSFKQCSRLVCCEDDCMLRAAFWRPRQENLEFKAGLGHILIPCLSQEEKLLRYVSTFVP